MCSSTQRRLLPSVRIMQNSNGKGAVLDETAAVNAASVAQHTHTRFYPATSTAHLLSCTASMVTALVQACALRDMQLEQQ